ncbi:MAG TPA: alanine/glycine:cation symporter family protein [Balneolales bacterium]|nr:alanine/glycine:cation symporter family protein [Balneolales bacterium]
MPLLVLLLGGGLYFSIYSRFVPLRHFPHAIRVLMGRYDDPDDPGDINHLQALMSALSATIGMGNISGVAVAIVMGGPGALFWMWVSAIVGMSTKFFTCTLAIMYRGADSQGRNQGGPMYWIREGLGKWWRPLAWFFCIAAVFGALPLFQANQLTQVFRDVMLIPHGIVTETHHFWSDFISGVIIAGIVSLVIFGGIKRIGQVAERLVPFMIVAYILSVVYILWVHVSEIPYYIHLVITDAFTGKAVAGGTLGSVLITGVRRAAFSNEAGIGTAPMVHGAAKTREPVREGLVAMLGPMIDTIIVCTMTAMAILITGVWKTTSADGVTLTLRAFQNTMPAIGNYVLVLSVATFSLSTLFTYSYYGTKSLGFLIGAEHKHWYNYFYVASIVFGSVASLTAAISFIDGMFAMMAIPTVITSVRLSPKVRAAMKDYFARMREMDLISSRIR